MRVQHVRKWCREFENDQMDTHGDDHSGWTSLSGMNVNSAQVEELIL
jgi:hypothetical protein